MSPKAKKQKQKRKPGGGRKRRYGEDVDTVMIGVRVPVVYKAEAKKVMADLCDDFELLLKQEQQELKIWKPKE